MFDEKSYSTKMDKAIEVFSRELTSLRTGRANAAMLDLVKVDVYGQQMPINQVGSITTPEPRMISIQVWDAGNVALVDAAIKKSDLGLNPQIDGQLIRLPVPELNEERRSELKKLIKSIGEKCKVSIRNIRREANDELKKLSEALEQTIDALTPKGRLVIITFHSIEDRIVKQFIRKHSRPKQLPKGLPVIANDDSECLLKDLGKIKPSDEEIKVNIRSRSAILRLVEKC